MTEETLIALAIILTAPIWMMPVAYILKMLIKMVTPVFIYLGRLYLRYVNYWGKK